MKKLLLLLASSLIFSSCSNTQEQKDSGIVTETTTDTTAETTADSSDTESSSETYCQEDEIPTSAIEVRKLFFNGECRYIESLSPTEIVVSVNDKYYNVYSGEESKFSSLLHEDLLVGNIIHIEGVPQNEMESNFYVDAQLFSDGSAAVLLAEDKSGYVDFDKKNAERLAKDLELPVDYGFAEIEGISDIGSHNAILIFPVFMD